MDFSQSGHVEAVVAPRSNLTGQRPCPDINFQDRYRVSPLSIYRQDEVFKAKMRDIQLQTGDVIHIFGTWKRLKTLQDEKGLLFSIPSGNGLYATGKGHVGRCLVGGCR